MTLKLTADQIAALDANPSLRLLDDRTNTEYALLRVDAWQAASLRTLEAAGWANPDMSEYDNYDENWKKVHEKSP